MARAKQTRTSGLAEGLTRYTIIMKETTVERFKDYAYTVRKDNRRAFDEIVTAFLDEFEKNNEIIKRPKED